MRVVIDRFEEEYAVCEKRKRKLLNIRRILVPPEAKEGDVLTIIGDYIVIDRDETRKRMTEAKKLMEELHK